MATQAQITANRLNAQHSTGPKTPQGQAACRYNATRHGLAGAQVVVKGEDPAAYDQLRAALLDEHRPASEAEAILVDEIAQNWWRLQRARRLEAEILKQYGELACFTEPEASKSFRQITRYLNRIERSWRQACAELAKLRKVRLEAESDRAQAAAFLAAVSSSRSPEELRARIGSVSSIPQYPPDSAAFPLTDPALQ